MSGERIERQARRSQTGATARKLTHYCQIVSLYAREYNKVTARLAPCIMLMREIMISPSSVYLERVNNAGCMQESASARVRSANL